MEMSGLIICINSGHVRLLLRPGASTQAVIEGQLLVAAATESVLLGAGDLLPLLIVLVGTIRLTKMIVVIVIMIVATVIVIATVLEAQMTETAK